MSPTTLNSLGIRFIVPILGAIFATGATIWLMEGVNPLGAFCILATVIMVMTAIVSPRAGLVLLLCLCAFSDLIKRMLVLFGSLNFEQVSNVLMAAPAVVVGLLMAIVTRRAFHQVKFRRVDLFIVAISLALALASFLLTKRAGGTFLESAKDAVNHGLYPAATLIGLRFFGTMDEAEGFLRKAMIVFFPVAVYGLVQLAFGFADFEIEYLRSGLTIEAKQLYDIRPRPFSTLNSAGVYGTLCAGFAVLALYPLLAARYRPYLAREKIGSPLVALVFLAGAIGSLVRSSHIVWVVAFVCLFCFRSRRGTIFFYVSGLGSLILLIFSAQFLLDHLEDLDPGRYGKSDYAAAVLTIQTYSDRLKSFVNLTTKPEIYSLFGLDQSRLMNEANFSHDPISTILMRYGVVGLVGAIVLALTTIFWIHRRLLAMPKGRERVLATLVISVLVGWLIAEVLVKAVITTFPLNALFWLLLGMLGHLVISTKRAPANRGGSAELAAAALSGTRPQPVLLRRESWNRGRTGRYAQK